MARVETGFNPVVHGFRFKNKFPGGHVLSELSAQGRLDEQIGISLPAPIRDVLSLASGASFWGTFGLCGGMSWTALDLYGSGQPVPADSAPPGAGTALFKTLVTRQADSLARAGLFQRVVTWQLLPDSTQWWRFWLDNVGKLVEEREWPQLRTALEAGRPQSLCLIRSRGVAGFANNHQVIATGYEVGPGGRVSVDLYDPNHPTFAPKLSFQTGAGFNRIDARQSSGEPVRGFFVWPHRPPG